MKELLDFVSDHQIFSLLFAVLAFSGTDFAIKKIGRHLSIIFRGWPPPHVDADGDLLEDIRLVRKADEEKKGVLK